MFAVNGMLLGGYGGSLPSLRDKIGHQRHARSPSCCSSAVMAGIVSMQVGGRLADAIGARKVTLLGAADPDRRLRDDRTLARQFRRGGVGGSPDRAGQRCDGRGDERTRRPGRARAPATDHELLPRLLLGREIRRKQAPCCSWPSCWTSPAETIVTPLMITLAMVAVVVLGPADQDRPGGRVVIDHKIDGVRTPHPARSLGAGPDGPRLRLVGGHGGRLVLPARHRRGRGGPHQGCRWG